MVPVPALLILAVLLPAAGAAAQAESRELVIESDSCSVHRYDLSGSTRSAESMEAIVRAVGPDPLRHGRFPFMLALCVDGDPGYRPCGTRRPSDPSFLHNAGVNLERSRELVAGLDGLPEGLAPLGRWLSLRYRFWIELMQRRLAYLGNRDPEPLLRPVEGVELDAACRSTTIGLPGPDAPADEVLPALNPWQRCANHLMHEVAGPYPVELWSAFLEEEGITETVETLDGCP